MMSHCDYICKSTNNKGQNSKAYHKIHAYKISPIVFISKPAKYGTDMAILGAIFLHTNHYVQL